MYIYIYIYMCVCILTCMYVYINSCSREEVSDGAGESHEVFLDAHHVRGRLRLQTLQAVTVQAALHRLRRAKGGTRLAEACVHLGV